jgi:hypothetical protein
VIFDLFDRIRIIKHARKAINEALRARGIASPYTKQVVYSMIILIEENCQEMKKILDSDRER